MTRTLPALMGLLSLAAVLSASSVARPPLHLAGSVTLDVADGGYNAFPDACQDDEGVIYRVWRRGTDVITSTDGVIVFQRGAVGPDGVVTWQPSSVIWSQPGRNLGDPSISCLANGSLVVSTSINDGPGIDNRYFGFLRTSEDAGMTWSEELPIRSSLGTGGNHREVPSAKVIEVPDGLYGLPIWGRERQATTDKALFLTAADLTGPWTEFTLATSPALWYSEPQVIVLRDGRLLALIREEVGRDIYAAVSDDGRTWTEPRFVLDAFGKPRLAQLASGVVMVAARADDGTAGGGRSLYALSYDQGIHWSRPEALGEDDGRFRYAGIVPLRSGLTLVTWSTHRGWHDAAIYSATFAEYD